MNCMISEMWRGRQDCEVVASPASLLLSCMNATVRARVLRVLSMLGHTGHACATTRNHSPHSHPFGRLAMSRNAFFLLVVTPGAGALLHPNGLLEVRVTSGAALTAVDKVESALGASASNAAGILLVVDDPSADQQRGDAELLASLNRDERVSLLRREHAVREVLRTASIPVTAVTAGRHLAGSAAGLFLAAENRLVNDGTLTTLTGCRLGLVPSGLALLGANTKDADHETRALAMLSALGGATLNAHDTCSLLHARCAPATEVPALLHELRTAPRDYLDVPISRRCAAVPEHHANLRRSLVIRSVDAVFGGAQTSVDTMRRTLREERMATERLLDSCAWRTRECAEAVDDVLVAAEHALDPARASPTAIAATVRVLRRAFDGRDGSPADAHALEMRMNARLAAREGFAQAATRRAARWAW